MKFDKLDAIEWHLLASIQMLALDANPYSTHVIVKAAHELVDAMAKHRGVPLQWDPQFWIKHEHLGDYKKIANKAYNYLKHADRDGEALYDGPEWRNLCSLNEVLTLLNIRGLTLLKKEVHPVLAEVSVFIVMKYPKFIRQDFLNALPEFQQGLSSISSDAEVIRTAIRQRLMNFGFWPVD